MPDNHSAIDLDTGLSSLDADDADLVRHLVERVRAAQTTELQQGLEAALLQLPRLLRGPARSILFG